MAIQGVEGVKAQQLIVKISVVTSQLLLLDLLFRDIYKENLKLSEYVGEV